MKKTYNFKKEKKHPQGKNEYEQMSSNQIAQNNNFNTNNFVNDINYDNNTEVKRSPEIHYESGNFSNPETYGLSGTKESPYYPPADYGIPSPTEAGLDIAQTYSEYSNVDPLGMWTGTPENKYEKPVQDADDL